jgi:hypothetical protein
MSTEDTTRIIQLIKKAQKEKRSKKDIIATFLAAGIIDNKGNLKKPYKEIYFPVSD